MRILILGGDGMLGHQLYQYFLPSHDVRVTLRRDFEEYRHYGIFSREKSYCNIDVRVNQRLESILADFLPDAVINAVGNIKQRDTKDDVLLNLEINAVLPHQLSRLCKIAKAKLIHLSTDCVFNGNKPSHLKYLESDLSDAEDIYGKTKFLGEVNEPHVLTLRSSIIGFELKNKKSLLEWVLAQRGSIRGYKHAIYSGFTTLEMARIIEKLLLSYPKAFGLYQVASDPINKYELLHLINKSFKLNLEILPNEEFSCNRSLNAERFNTTFHYKPPAWLAMIGELATKKLEKRAKTI